MYVYVKDWMIIYKSDKKVVRGFVSWADVYIVDCRDTDKLIFEGNQVKIYENSNQYNEDMNTYHLSRQVDNLSRKNEELLKIANTKVTKEMELEVKWKEANEYQRKLYLLKNMRWSQQS